MWHKTIAVLALSQILNSISANAAFTWPSPSDEIEDLMYLQSGYRAQGFATAVTPCTNSPIQGFRVAAGFVRTAFHDTAAHNQATGADGLDGSIAYELQGTYAVHNTGPGFNATVNYMYNFFNPKASMADLIALGVYASVRSCGGPQIAMRSGRIDATGPGPDALPDAADSKEVLTGRFAKMGFSPQEMIQITACGHTLGGVHPAANPPITNGSPQSAQQAQVQGVLTFDTTDAQFDNKVVREYLDGTTRNPLVVGPAALNSDLRVYSLDNNQTVSSMASSSGSYNAQCQQVLQKMIEMVPGNVQLSDVIVPYDVKPGQINLQVTDNGQSLLFSGEVRVRTTVLSKSSIARVQIAYQDQSGQSGTVDATGFKDSFGFDDSFTWFGFSTKVKSVASFNVLITTTGGQTRTFDNNGNSFPVNDNAFVQWASSSLNGGSANIVVAVRSTQQGTPSGTVSSKSPMVFNTLPQIQKSQLSFSKVCSDSLWTYYSASANVASFAKLDVSVGGQVVDAFRSFNFGSSGAAPVCGGATSSSSTTTASSTSRSSTLLTTSGTSSKLSSSLSVSATLIGSSSTLQSSSPSSSISSFTSSGSSIPSTTSTSSALSNSGSSTTTSNTDDAVLTSTSSVSGLSTTTSDLAISSTSATSINTDDAVLTSTSSVSGISSTTTDDDNGRATTTTTDSTNTATTSDNDNPPAWTVYNPGSPEPSISMPNYSVNPQTTGGGNDYVPINDSGSAAANQAANALSQIYKDNYNEPAPSGGTDGGDKNIEGLDLNVSVVFVEPTVTAASSIGSTGGWEGWTESTPAPTPVQGESSQPAAVGNGQHTQTQGGKPAASTSTSPVGVFHGAATSVVARGEVVMMWAAAVIGVLAIVL